MIELASDMLPKDWATTCQLTAKRGWHIVMECRHRGCRAKLVHFTGYPDGSGLTSEVWMMEALMRRHYRDCHGPADVTFWLGVEGEQL